mgnify:CR=1 FL=1
MTTPQVLDANSAAIIAAEDEHVAHNYHPLPVVIASGEGAWVTARAFPASNGAGADQTIDGDTQVPFEKYAFPSSPRHASRRRDESSARS